MASPGRWCARPEGMPGATSPPPFTTRTTGFVPLPTPAWAVQTSCCTARSADAEAPLGRPAESVTTMRPEPSSVTDTGLTPAHGDTYLDDEGTRPMASFSAASARPSGPVGVVTDVRTNSRNSRRSDAPDEPAVRGPT